MQNSSHNKIKKIRLGEFFSGPGGIAYGAHLAATKTNLFVLEHAWAVDNHPSTCETYIRNINGASFDSVFCEDIKTFNFQNLRNIASKIDGFAFGFPCNDFSLVGQQKGINGKFGPLYTYGIKALNLFQPSFFIAENVGGLTSANKGAALEKILKELEAAGYLITPHLYKFEEYGVPQARHRLIIVGIKKSLNLTFKVPAPTHKNKFITVADALELKPIRSDAYNNDKTNQSELVVERLKYILPGQNAWNASLPKHLRLNVKGAKLSQIYKRLEPDKPSYTITGSGGGGTHVYHWREPRALTNRERARLQTFPDSFEFIGSKESVRRQIGMAVPPLGAKVIFEAVVKTLLGLPYNSVEVPSLNSKGR
jgi:DNA (cytosine-5)-methyltransferase 1